MKMMNMHSGASRRRLECVREEEEDEKMMRKKRMRARRRHRGERKWCGGMGAWEWGLE